MQNPVSGNPRTLSFPPFREPHLGWPCLCDTLSTCPPHQMLLDVIEGEGRLSSAVESGKRGVLSLGVCACVYSRVLTCLGPHGEVHAPGVCGHCLSALLITLAPGTPALGCPRPQSARRAPRISSLHKAARACARCLRGQGDQGSGRRGSSSCEKGRQIDLFTTTLSSSLCLAIATRRSSGSTLPPSVACFFG
jgi:hypothetical protein